MIYENLFIKADEKEVRRVLVDYAKKNNLVIEEGYGGNVVTFKPSGRRLLIFSYPKDMYYFNVIFLHPEYDVLHIIFRIRESEYEIGYKLYLELRNRFISIDEKSSRA
ncbi:TPA: hypothetical protein EYP83_02710 [Candidatus Geothermarchaeota archaeon]|nr:hypothetical protein [Candidatus Geothermarchaeota archaeon]